MIARAQALPAPHREAPFVVCIKGAKKQRLRIIFSWRFRDENDSPTRMALLLNF